jgi:hypothetical protein
VIFNVLVCFPASFLQKTTEAAGVEVLCVRAFDTHFLPCAFAYVSGICIQNKDAINSVVRCTQVNSSLDRLCSALRCAMLLPICTALQALSQYLVNLNVWSHNLLVLLARTYRKAAAAAMSPDAKPGPGSAASAALAQSANAHSAAEHQPLHWLAASGFVVAYSYLVSNMIPYFSCMVGIVSSSTYLVCAYTLPCWFALKLLRGSMASSELVLSYVLLGLSLPLSLLGLSSSVTSLVRNLGCKNCRFEPWALQAVFLLWLFVMLNVIGFRYKRVAKQQLSRQCWTPLLEKSRNSSSGNSSSSNLLSS